MAIWRNPWEDWNVEVPANGYDYIIYTDGTNVYAKNGKTGEIEFSGTDAASVIQNVINVLESNGGGIVFIAKGTYNIQSTIKITNNNIWLFGDAQQTVFDGSGSGTILQITGTFDPWREIQNFRIEGIKFQNADIGIESIVVDNIAIEKNYFHNLKTAIHVQRDLTVTIKDNYFDTCGSSASSTEVIKLDTNGISNGNTGILIGRNTFQPTEYIVIGIYDYFDGVHIKENWFESHNGTAIVYINNQFESFNIQIVGNRMQQNSGDTFDYFIRFEDNIYVNDMNITRNIIHANSVTHIISYPSQYGSRIDISHNQLVGVADWSIYARNVDIISENIISNSNGSGIYAWNDPTISTNRVKVTSGKIGIEVDWSDYGIVVGNEIDADTTAVYLNRNHAGFSTVTNNTIKSGGQIVLAQGDALIRHNKGYTTENSGTATFSGDGSTTQFTIAHGLVSTPNYVSVQPKAGAPVPDSVDADDTNITLTFNTAPASGTYYYWWEARV